MDRLFVMLILLLSVQCILVVSSSCGPYFQDKCTCGRGKYVDRGEEFIVNCTNAGFTNTSSLEHLPQETQVLIFTGNYIPELPWNVFGTINSFSNLRVVDMSNNHIREIKGKSYHRVANVERLILNHNNLSISSFDDIDHQNHHHPRVFSNFDNLVELHLTNAFADNTPKTLARDLHDIFVNSNLTKLIKLHLEQNEIRYFQDKQVFCELKNLRDLYLGDNLLTGLDFNVTCLSNLHFIDLRRNNLDGLSAEDLKILDSLPARKQDLMLDITSNPFKCDCAVQELYTWLQTTQVEVRNKDYLRCHHGLPERNDGETILTLRQLQCQPKEESLATQHHATAIVLSFLFIVLAALFVGAIYMHRTDLKRQLRPIFESVSRKVHYTHIGKHEDQEMDV